MTLDELVKVQECEHLSMKNRRGWEALDLLCSSQRIMDDLDRSQHQPTNQVSIIGRPWVDISPWQELRGFIKDRQLTALSQYYTAQHFHELWDRKQLIGDMAQEFVEASLGPCMPMEDAVVDLMYDPQSDQLLAIELNPFGRCSGSALFSWAEDREILNLSLIHISEPTRLLSISYAVFCLKKKKKKQKNLKNGIMSKNETLKK
eukprot:TRINITY_DN5028_c0_g1_i13.p1 TRINITY_DN5028_c0_g1~~TRINITY_DN5028_c0_g1_i13.p1  ORF type:complete len:204 (-),score=47.82 TRINITY_DN5028_c0_g1_i13:3-614(-)